MTQPKLIVARASRVGIVRKSMNRCILRRLDLGILRILYRFTTSVDPFAYDHAYLPHTLIIGLGVRLSDPPPDHHAPVIRGRGRVCGRGVGSGGDERGTEWFENLISVRSIERQC